MVNIPSTIGYLAISARGIIATADSNDVGDEPDAYPMVATVKFTPSISDKMLVAIAETDRPLVGLDSVICELDETGELRPPQDGKRPPIDATGILQLIAPQQPAALSQYGWDWIATFTPFSGQEWGEFSFPFSGAPNAAINLSDAYIENKARTSGVISPPLRAVPGPILGPDDLPPDAKRGEYILDQSDGTIYRVGTAGELVFFADIKGPYGDPGIQEVSHGTNASTVRPVGVPVVYWIGTATPTNAIEADLWMEY